MPNISSGQIPGRKRTLRTVHITEREDQRAAGVRFRTKNDKGGIKTHEWAGERVADG